MTTLTQTDLPALADDLQATAQNAIQDPTPEAFSLLEHQINRFESQVRELQQSIWAPKARAAIRKLQTGKPIDAEAVATIRALVVSDAEHYLKHENNLDDWLEELQRLISTIAELSQLSDESSLADLRGVVRDAVRLVPNIRAYTDERRRLTRFDAALAHLDDDNRRLLAQLLIEKLDSPHR